MYLTNTAFKPKVRVIELFHSLAERRLWDHPPKQKLAPRKYYRLGKEKQPWTGHKASQPIWVLKQRGMTLCSLNLFYFSVFFLKCLKFLFSPYRKRAESDSRKSSIPNSKEVPSHHPTDPVELRRLNFQTPGKRHDSSCPCYSLRWNCRAQLILPWEMNVSLCFQ